MTTPMKTRQVIRGIFGISTSIALAMVAKAESDITWQTPTTISGPSDVNNSGSLLGTWAPYNGAAASGGLVVNGVNFNAFPTLPGATDTFDNGGGNGTFATPSTSDNNYNNLLNAGAFGNTSNPYTITWNGMTQGDTYLVQLWVNDGRNATVNARNETITGGANTSLPLFYGSGSSGPGQFIIGTFVADSSLSETLTLSPDQAVIPSAQFNLIQVRDITSVPEPSAVALSLVGFGLLVGVYRKK